MVGIGIVNGDTSLQVGGLNTFLPASPTSHYYYFDPARRRDIAPAAITYSKAAARKVFRYMADQTVREERIGAVRDAIRGAREHDHHRR